MNWTSADIDKATSRPQRPATAPNAPRPAPIPAAPKEAPVAPESRYCQGYGIATRADAPGSRFVAWGASAECAAELAAVALRHGLRPSDTRSFIPSSSTH